MNNVKKFRKREEILKEKGLLRFYWLSITGSNTSIHIFIYFSIPRLSLLIFLIDLKFLDNW